VLIERYKQLHIAKWPMCLTHFKHGSYWLQCSI